MPARSLRSYKHLRSEREDDRGIGKVDVAAGAGVADKIAGEKVAVAQVHQRVTLDLPVEQQIQLLPDFAGVAGRIGAKHRSGGAIQRIVVALPPEEVIVAAKRDLLGKRLFLQQRRFDARMQIDDVLPADDVDVAE